MNVPIPSTNKAGDASTTVVLDKSIVALEPPITNPPQREPRPVEERVAAPASMRPSTVICPPSAILNETPSSMVSVPDASTAKLPSRKYGLH